MNLNHILTEKRNPQTLNIDELSSLEIVKKINEEDHQVPQAINKVLPVIALLVDEIVSAFKQGGRLIYIGAGTSGRLGVLDASEGVPTFGTPAEQVIGIIAGGDKALRHALEGAEDNKKQAIEDLKAINLSNKDILVGIAASGRTPYTLSALAYANSLGAVTGCVVNSPQSPMEQEAKYAIVAESGPEVVTGSTRMKAGTAQKLVLNMLTTASMIQIGKVYSNLMVDVQPTNDKLVQRAKNIIAELTGVSPEEAAESLQTYKTPKAAILALLTSTEGDEVHRLLDKHDGHLKKAIGEAMEQPTKD
ncbi:N-acetylmuramic acid 6-phosphate etherase [Priestia megaterium]|uniref:N-acetylmuramic acid 6-phosphate etherase n=1 Tax=Priestia megaterium (strain ATCC 14581 / DSM 32 / CCUG 1817 / JCM 2506 / NBRC 15308 / NCIMB 9376 / NCTC 10342 / NRRL B-14308 / VKM B-512 / Ford 19) TaxID=1348623 RepID=A0A0B6AM25_PRIM2|nr:N-acetylmuramic acid 6-phosphate etherase [Priestia megaterium]AJI22132.1 N-acetylmuramic acid 6-phosphate etherase [Priestia megaterium NBRC 15308 = ATCC 14581]KFM97525.1 N-acetylmuramic acid 6-phosphate etherase [Priestia megaterium]KGJ76071.1 N-acetylmuramic acid-6-phosphate etherase [Priestia megaterium NBRC 15308 = ATCC 14581]MDR4232160.1 N-acetylmuramic acid 6-phosphate etherase [Priestia megaterium]MED4393862.1 N-acetylmuramic acid 6-phosphate etherase [Priestia megaterium]